MRPKFKARSLGRYSRRHKPGEMNQTEQLFADVLQADKTAGLIVEWWFECFTFKLADGCRWTPDFGLLRLDGHLAFVDVKGGGPIQDDALVKIKCAAERFFMFDFSIIKRRAKKAGGGWDIREFNGLTRGTQDAHTTDEASQSWLPL